MVKYKQLQKGCNDSLQEMDFMVREQDIRTERLIGEEGLNCIKQAKVAVFGVGGVGGFATEALARAGVGTIAMIDFDTIAESNLNRQIIALHSTIGRLKVDVLEERMKDINPEIHVVKYPMFYLPENAEKIDFSQFDYIIDAVDTVSAKISIITRADAEKIPVISSMGAGNKLDATQFKVADLSKTSVCPLARVMRRELKARNVKTCKVVYSTEAPVKRDTVSTERKPVIGSISYAPGTAGLLLAGEVIKDLIDKEK